MPKAAPGGLSESRAVSGRISGESAVRATAGRRSRDSARGGAAAASVARGVAWAERVLHEPTHRLFEFTPEVGGKLGSGAGLRSVTDRQGDGGKGSDGSKDRDSTTRLLVSHGEARTVKNDPAISEAIATLRG